MQRMFVMSGLRENSEQYGETEGELCNMMTLCGCEIKKGETKIVPIPVKDRMELKAICVCGSESKDSLTLVVTAGVHGCEYVGIEAAFRLAERLSEMTMRGNVIIVPVVNQSGFIGGYKQIVPEDGVNLNRAFPADAATNTGLSAHIARTIEEHIYPEADFLLDLHCGDWNEALTPLVFYPAAGEKEVNERAEQAARCLSVPYRVRSFAKNGLYSYAVQSGIPALLLERGCAGRWSEREVEETMADVLRLLAFLRICETEETGKDSGKDSADAGVTDVRATDTGAAGAVGPKQREHMQIDITTAVYEESDTDGFWYPCVSAGETVEKGQLLGTFVPMESKWETNHSAEDRREIYAQFPGVVLYLTEALGVCGGEALVAYGRS